MNVALDVRDANPNEPTIFITKDVNLRIRADALGLKSMDYEAGQVDAEDLYTGISELEVSGDEITTFYNENTLDLSRHKVVPNEYLLLKNQDSPRTRRSAAWMDKPPTGSIAQASRRRLGHSAAQQGTTLCARSSAF